MANVKNKDAKVENLVEEVIDFETRELTMSTFKECIELDNLKNICDSFSDIMKKELIKGSFMTLDLELSEEQVEKMKEHVDTNMKTARIDYQRKIDKLDRTKKVAEIVIKNMKKISKKVLSGIAQEVNRGAMISCSAVAADTKNSSTNKIELNYSKLAGDITIPSKGIFIATNCVDIVENSIEIDLSGEEKIIPDEDKKKESE